MNRPTNTSDKMSRRDTKSGFGLLETMIAVGILGIIMMGIVSLSSIVLKSQSQSNLIFQADSARRSIVNALNGPASWKATVMDAANNKASGPMLDCLSTSAPGPSQPGYVCTLQSSPTTPVDVMAGGTPIGQGNGQPILKIVNAAGGTVYDATQPNFGISPQGTLCTNFVDPINGPGNDSCPLRYNVLWWAKCKCTNLNCVPPVAGDSCVDPQVQFQVVALFNPSVNTRLAFNPANYGTPTFIQGTAPGGGVCWAQSSGNLVDTCTGNVGIGTMAPAGTLDVEGGTAVAGNGTNINLFSQNGQASGNSNGGSIILQPGKANGTGIPGYVGIGTATPQASLDVNGVIKSTVGPANATTTVDFSTGNLQATSASCAGMILKNMKSGSTYSLVVQGTAGGTCSFTAYSDNGITLLTFRKSGSVALTQTANKHVIFTFLVVNTNVYVAAIDGYI